VKVASIALSIAFAITGLSGLGTLSIGNARICHGDFIWVCDPIEPSPSLLVLFAAGAIAASLLLMRVSKPSKKCDPRIARSQ